MLYRKNLGSIESLARTLGGAALAAFALYRWGVSPQGLGLAAGGAFTALTGVLGWCPACALVRRRPPEPRA
jgi:hypothetical protein